jgi:hypothetical protein
MRKSIMTPVSPFTMSVHTSRCRATPTQAQRACPHTHAACRSQSHRLGAVAAPCVRLVSSSSLAKLIAGGRARNAGWMRRRRAWCANAVRKLRTAVRPRQFRHRRRLSCRRRVPLTVAWARQGRAPCPGKVRALLFLGRTCYTMEPEYHTEPAIKGSLAAIFITHP